MQGTVEDDTKLSQEDRDLLEVRLQIEKIARERGWPRRRAERWLAREVAKAWKKGQI